MLARLIPADDSAGPVPLGVDAVPGLDDLLARLSGFAALAEADQEETLRALDESGDEAFAMLLTVAHASYYAEPRSWASLGYTTNVPGRP